MCPAQIWDRSLMQMLLDSSGATTCSWIIDTLLWINQTHGCRVDALLLVMVTVMASCDRVGCASPLIIERRRMGAFQCTGLFASASKRDFHATLVYVSVSICPSSPSSSTSHFVSWRCWGEERWDVVMVTVSQLIGRAVVASDPVERRGVCVESTRRERCRLWL